MAYPLLSNIINRHKKLLEALEISRIPPKIQRISNEDLIMINHTICLEYGVESGVNIKGLRMVEQELNTDNSDDTVFLQATRIFYTIIKNNPFKCANDSTALIATISFLQRNKIDTNFTRTGDYETLANIIALIRHNGEFPAKDICGLLFSSKEARKEVFSFN